MRNWAYMVIGAAVTSALPITGVIEASTRIIPFIALLMAGVIPTMMQTVTVLKGDDLSPKAVNEYSAALRAQLRFWVGLLICALVSVAALILAVVLSKASFRYDLVLGRSFTDAMAVRACIIAFGAFAALVLAKLRAAYSGLTSILELNIEFASIKARKNNLAVTEGLTKEAIQPRISEL